MSNYEAKIPNAIVALESSVLLGDGVTLDESVADGSIGFIDLKTRKTKGTFADVGKFAMKVKDDVVRSDLINASKVLNIHKEDYSATLSKEIKLSGFDKLKCCENGFSLAFDVQNQMFMRLNPNTPGFFTYSWVGCGDCEELDANDIVHDLVTQINSDKGNFLTAIPLDASNAEITDWETFYNTNHAVNTDADNTNDVVASVKIVADTLAVEQACTVHNIYYDPRLTNFDVVVNKPCNCGDLDISVLQEVQVGVGEGQQVLFMEGYAQGWQGRRPDAEPFSNTGAVGIVEQKPLYTDVSKNYVTYAIDYMEDEPYNNMTPTIHYKKLFLFVPTGNTALITSLDTFLGIS